MFSVKKVSRKQSRLNKPWLSNVLIKCITKKNSLYKKYLRNPTMDRQSIYKSYKNKLNHSLRIAKRLYNEKKWNNVQSNTRAAWKVLNEILNRSKRNSNRCSTFKADDREISDPVEIANKFCSYFSSIGLNLARGIQSSASLRSILNGSFTQSIFFNTITEDEIAEIAKTLLPGTPSDRGEFSVGILLDLSKAFDTVNHVILFDKLEHCGIRGLALDWIRSYFSNRKQYVEYNGHRSLRNEISCGVPQGSILGPLFFLLYINDINNASNLLNLTLFADDTNVFMSHKDQNYLSDVLNSERDKL